MPAKYVYTYESLLFEEDCIIVNKNIISYEYFFGNNPEIHCYLYDYGVYITSTTCSLQLNCGSDSNARGIYNFVQNNLYKIKDFVKTNKTLH